MGTEVYTTVRMKRCTFSNSPGAVIRVPRPGLDAATFDSAVWDDALGVDEDVAARRANGLIEYARSRLTAQQVSALAYYPMDEVLEMTRSGDQRQVILDSLKATEPERNHTRIDDTFVAWIASPIWALVWCMTAGVFGKPLWRVA